MSKLSLSSTVFLAKKLNQLDRILNEKLLENKELAYVLIKS